MKDGIIKDLADIKVILDKYGSGASNEFEISFNLNEAGCNKLKANIMRNISDDVVIYSNIGLKGSNPSILSVCGIKIIINTV